MIGIKVVYSLDWAWLFDFDDGEREEIVEPMLRDLQAGMEDGGGIVQFVHKNQHTTIQCDRVVAFIVDYGYEPPTQLPGDESL